MSSLTDGSSVEERRLLEAALDIALAPDSPDRALRLAQRLTIGEINATRALCLRVLDGRPRRTRDLLRLLDVLDEALDRADSARRAGTTPQ